MNKGAFIGFMWVSTELLSLYISHIPASQLPTLNTRVDRPCMLDFDIGPAPSSTQPVVCVYAGVGSVRDIRGGDITMNWCEEGCRKAFACCPWNAVTPNKKMDGQYYVS